MSWARTAAAKAGALGLAAGAMGIGVAHAAADDKYFDPEALERGAKALREIQNSPFAKKVRCRRRRCRRRLPAACRNCVLALCGPSTPLLCRPFAELQVFEQIKTQEQTKQAELKAKEAEFNAQAAQAAIVSWRRLCLLWPLAAGLPVHSTCFCMLDRAKCRLSCLRTVASANHLCRPSYPPPAPSLPRIAPHPQQQEKVRWEEQRRSMQQDAQQKAQLAQYQVRRMEASHDLSHGG